MSIVSLSHLFRKYTHLILKLRQKCFDAQPKEAALAITFGFFIGIIPFIGLTFIVVTTIGLILRLNQYILQTVHLLASPIQFLLLPVFIETGQILFSSKHVSISHINLSCFITDFFHTLSLFGNILLYGIIVWLCVFLLCGFFLYKILLFLLR